MHAGPIGSAFAQSSVLEVVDEKVGRADQRQQEMTKKNEKKAAITSFESGASLSTLRTFQVCASCLKTVSLFPQKRKILFPRIVLFLCGIL